jgi:hypothetical protein
MGFRFDVYSRFDNPLLSAALHNSLRIRLRKQVNLYMLHANNR